MSANGKRVALVEILRFARSLPREWPWPDAPVVIPARLWREHLDDCDAAAEMLADAAPVEGNRICSWCGMEAPETNEENACAPCVRYYGLAPANAEPGAPDRILFDRAVALAERYRERALRAEARAATMEDEVRRCSDRDLLCKRARAAEALFQWLENALWKIARSEECTASCLREIARRALFIPRTED